MDDPDGQEMDVENVTRVRLVQFQKTTSEPMVYDFVITCVGIGETRINLYILMYNIC